MKNNLPTDLSSLINRMVDIVCMINAESTILYINDASFKVLGYYPEEMIGKNVFEFIRVEDQDRSAKAMNDFMNDRDMSYFTNRFVAKNSEIVEVEWYNSWDEKKNLLFGIAKNLTQKAIATTFLYNESSAPASAVTLTSISLFQGIEPADIDALEEAATFRSIKKGTALRFPQFSNKYAYFLAEGVMKTVTTNAVGKELIKFLVKPGDLIGDIPILEQYERPNNYAIALQDSTVILLDMAILTNLFTKYDFFRIKLKQQVARRIHKIEDRLSAVIHKKASERVGNFLAEFVLEFGRQEQDEWIAGNFLTHEDIAQLCSVSRQKVSQFLSEFKKNGSISYDKAYMRIKQNSSLLTGTLV